MAQKLELKSWAITGAVLWGVYLFVAPILMMVRLDFYWFSSKAFDLLQSIYPGLQATVGGAFIGLIHGIICGAICAGLFAWVHNLTLKYSK